MNKDTLHPDKAKHFSEGKSGVEQIPPAILLELGDVYTFGANKYGRDNWKQGAPWYEFIGSALRHLLKFAGGEDRDPESGLPHLAHAMWNLVCLRYYQLFNIGEDTRE